MALAARRTDGDRRRDRRRRGLCAAALRAVDARRNPRVAGADRGLGRVVDAGARAPDAPSPAAGRRIGAYRLERELAEGGMATVHLARHALLKRPTAIKILKRHIATDEVAARFEREVRLVERTAAPEHDRDLRLRAHARRPALLRDGVRRRPDPRRACRPRARAAAGTDAPYRRAGVRGAGRSARQGHGPPRHQARECDDLRTRRRV